MTSQPPFSYLSSDISVAMAVLKGDRPVLPSAVIPKETVFEPIRALLDSCWAEKITHRPDAPTVLDFLKHIQALFRGHAVVSNFGEADSSVLKELIFALLRSTFLFCQCSPEFLRQHPTSGL